MAFFKYIIEMDSDYVNPKITNARRLSKSSLKANYYGIKMGNGPTMPTTKDNFILYAGSIGRVFPELM